MPKTLYAVKREGSNANAFEVVASDAGVVSVRVNDKALLGAQSAAVAAVAGLIPAGGVGAAAGGWDTAGNRDTAIVTIGEIKTQLNDLLAKLRAHGIIAT